MAILNFSVCKGHAWFWSCRLCLSSFSGHCCEASAVKSASDGQRRVMFFHIMSCVEKFIQRCLSLVHMFSIVFNNFCPTGKVPNRRDHGSLSQNRPRIVHQQFISLKKKHFYTRCAGLSVYALLTIYTLYRVPHCMSPRWNWDSPIPSPRQRVSPSPRYQGGGGAYSPAGERWGVLIPTRRHTVVLFIYIVRSA